MMSNTPRQKSEIASKISLTPGLHRCGDLKRVRLYLYQRVPSNETDTKYGSTLLGEMAERIMKKREIETTEAFDVLAISQATIRSEAESQRQLSSVIIHGSKDWAN